MNRIITGWLTFMLVATPLVVPTVAQAETAAEIYARRVLPILRSQEPSSCTQCHLRGVELKQFLEEDPVKSFANLRARGWIDLDNPEQSKLLSLIGRGEATQDALLHKVRENELSALKQWILLAVKDTAALAQPLPAQSDLALQPDFILHARTDRTLAQFADAIWSQLGRCVNCHSPDRNAKLVKEHGPGMSWIVPGQPQATLRLLVERKIIDLQRPEESPLRTKPLMIVEHGGGPKFVLQSETDTSWKAFLNDYAKTVRSDGYQPGEVLPQLPARRRWLSELQVRLTDVPVQYAGQHLVVTLHRQLGNQQIAELPSARGDSLVNEKQSVWQQALSIYETVDADRAEAAPVVVGGNVPRPVDLNRLAAKKRELLATIDWTKPIAVSTAIPAGEYVLRVWARDLTAPVATDDAEPPRKIVAAFSLAAPWPPGYQPPKIISWNNRLR